MYEFQSETVASEVTVRVDHGVSHGDAAPVSSKKSRAIPDEFVQDTLHASSLLQRSALGLLGNADWTRRFASDAQNMADLLRAMGFVGVPGAVTLPRG